MSEVIWEARLRDFELEGMDDDKKKEFIRDLEKAIMHICWEYGVHN